MTMDTGGVPFVGNFDGMGNLDFATFSGGYWHVKDHNGAVFMNVTLGGMFDTAVPADYDGDGKMEIAVYTPSFKWLVYPLQQSQINPVWGEPGAIPVPAR